MNITYDKKTDAMYIRLNTKRYKVTKKVTDNVLVDYAADGAVIGLEILDASRMMKLPTESQKLGITTIN